MTCPKCKKALPEGANFCAYCGRRLVQSRSRKPKRSPNGTGCAYQRPGQRTWTASVVIGYRDPPPLDLANPDNARQRVPIKRTKGGFETKAAALAYCATLKAGGHLRPDTAPTLAYYWKVYADDLAKLSASKQTAYTIAWDKLSDIHDAQIDQLTVDNLRQAVGKRCTTYYPAKDCRTVLTNLYRLAAADGYANKDLPSFINLPKLTEKEQEPFSETEQAALWRLYESGDLRACIPLLMIYSGLMPGETFDLRVDQIHLDTRQIIGAGKKTNVRKETPVVLAANILPVVEDLIAHARPSGRLFGTSEDKWRADYYGALEAAGCRKLPPYSCRHTIATALAITEGIAPQTIKKVMRWSTTKMLDRYAHPDQADALAAVDQIGGSSVGSEAPVSKEA